jgi:glutamine synthetase
MADSVMIYKYMVKNVARQNGLTATFMPKPLFGDNGSGHALPPVDLEGREERFYDEAGYAQLSDTAKYYIGGLLKHAPALLALVRAHYQLVPPPRARF